jgi:hypothetical protein
MQQMQWFLADDYQGLGGLSLTVLVPSQQLQELLQMVVVSGSIVALQPRFHSCCA